MVSAVFVFSEIAAESRLFGNAPVFMTIYNREFHVFIIRLICHDSSRRDIHLFSILHKPLIYIDQHFLCHIYPKFGQSFPGAQHVWSRRSMHCTHLPFVFFSRFKMVPYLFGPIAYHQNKRQWLIPPVSIYEGTLDAARTLINPVCWLPTWNDHIHVPYRVNNKWVKPTRVAGNNSIQVSGEIIAVLKPTRIRILHLAVWKANTFLEIQAFAPILNIKEHSKK